MRHHLMRLCLCLLVSAMLAGVAVPARAEPAEQPKAAAASIDFRTLKEFLPEKVGDIARKDATGQRTTLGEFKISQATGEYRQDDKDANAEITLIDYGAAPGMAQGMAGWMNMDIDQESDNEYTKTIKIGDFKALETYNKKSKSGSLTLLAGDRVMVTIQINDMPAETLKATAEAMKLKEISALK